MHHDMKDNDSIYLATSVISFVYFYIVAVRLKNTKSSCKYSKYSQIFINSRIFDT